MNFKKNFFVGFFLVFSSLSVRADIVAGASDLRYALDEVVNNYKTEKSKNIRTVYGSSGLLYQQIKNNAPFSIFMSADEQYIELLEKDGRTRDKGHLYAIGRIVLILKKSSNLNVAINEASLREAIIKAKKIAIANPDHAPYGRAAKQTLESLGLWELAKNKLVFGENISQATNFVLTGSADFGISALSLAISPNVAKESNYILIPDKLHKPLNQKMVVLKGSSDTANDFYEYLRNKKSKEIFKKYGFVVPN
jgi:molybdate transport system substrate-binding protein